MFLTPETIVLALVSRLRRAAHFASQPSQEVTGFQFTAGMTWEIEIHVSVPRVCQIMANAYLDLGLHEQYLPCQISIYMLLYPPRFQFTLLVSRISIYKNM